MNYSIREYYQFFHLDTTDESIWKSFYSHHSDIPLLYRLGIVSLDDPLHTLETLSKVNPDIYPMEEEIEHLWDYMNDTSTVFESHQEVTIHNDEPIYVLHWPSTYSSTHPMIQTYYQAIVDKLIPQVLHLSIDEMLESNRVMHRNFPINTWEQALDIIKEFVSE
jgi:hypothetical protein